MALRWYEVFADALDRAETIGVAATVRPYFSREPTRAEITAARRRANSFAAAGRAELFDVPVKGTRMLVLARPATERPADELLHAVATGRSLPRATRRGRPRSERRTVDTLARHITSAGRAARRVDVDRLSPDDAAAFAADLADSLHDLDRLRERLKRRAARVS